MRYEVLPRNLAFGSRVIEADGYEWGIERVVFWGTLPLICTTWGSEAIEVGDGGVLRVKPGQAYTPARQTVAEFAVDWVAGIETAKDS